MDGKTADIGKDGFSVMYEFYPKHPRNYPICHEFDDSMVLLQHLPTLLIFGVLAISLGNVWLNIFMSNQSFLNALPVTVIYLLLARFALFLLYAHILMWRHHNTMIKIDKEYIAFVKHYTDREKTVISFDRIYHAELKQRTQTWYKIVLYYVEFSDDGLYYKKHKSTIGYASNLFGMGERANHIVGDIIHTMQAYHDSHEVNLPKVNYIKQKFF